MDLFSNHDRTTIQHHDTMNTTDVCTMPDHGLETAAAECCRPSSPHFRAPRPAPPKSKPFAFWRDLPVWKTSARNTFNCLIGCSIGDFGDWKFKKHGQACH